jgi:hypothetical protein
MWGGNRYFLAQIINRNVQIRNGSVRFQNGTEGKLFGAEEAGLAKEVDLRVAGSTVVVANGRLFLL